MEHRRYSDNERATALAILDANEGNVNKTAKETGIPRKTLSEWNNGRIHSEVAEIRQDKKADLSDMFEDAARKYLSHAIQEKVIEKTVGASAIVAAATATDKMRLLRGLPTEIVALMPEVIVAIHKLGKEPVTIFNDIIRRANELPTDRPVD